MANAGKLIRLFSPRSARYSLISLDILRCSERPISFAEFREMLPSRCTLGESFCQGTCHAIGRRDGSCEYGRVSYLLAVLIKCGRNLLLLICRVVNVLRKGWALLSSCFAPLSRLVGPIANAEARLMEGAMDGNASVLAMLLLKILKPKYFKFWEVK